MKTLPLKIMILPLNIMIFVTVDGAWNRPAGTQYWKWKDSSDGKRYALQLRQAHFNKYASTSSLPGPGEGRGELYPNADPSKAVSTMTRSQMNSRLTLAKKLEVRSFIYKS